MPIVSMANRVGGSSIFCNVQLVYSAPAVWQVYKV